MGKIIIKKKSGPGELTGITEMDISMDNKSSATFKDLQFTEEGNYILSITSTANDVEPLEISISVLKEDTIIAQPESKGTDIKSKETDGSKPIIAQIDKPTIVIPPIKMDQDKIGDQTAYTAGLGYTPFIWYKAYSIEDRNIQNLKLYHDGIIPKIEFTFNDSKDIMKGINTPTDDSTIELFLNSTSKNLKSLHIVFKIEDFIQNKNNTYTINGTINIPDLYVVNNNSYNDTSFGALRTICKELGIGFNSNISDTKDKMPWRNSHRKPFEFINEIISYSYISDESFMIGYIDYYYCFNYVDIEKEMSRDATNDMGINTSGISQHANNDESERLINLKLTNDKAQNASSNYITNVVKINNSTNKSLKDGYATINKSYDKLNKQFLEFKVDSTTSDGSDSIILKGGENDDSYQNANIKHKFTGKIDTDNVHQNYNYSVTQNSINLTNLNKIALNVTLPNPNWNLYKFQKINVQLINQTSTPANPSILDARYSGYYIIADIEYLWNNGKMSQKLRLVRKELGKTPDETKNGPLMQTKKDDKENNENPMIGNTASTTYVSTPNSVYNVGQTYNVLDNDGKIYEIKVMQLLENGIEIIGELKRKF